MRNSKFMRSTDIRPDSGKVFSRRRFLERAPLAALAAGSLAAAGSGQEEAGTGRAGQDAKKDRAFSSIRVGQVKVYPKKGDLPANHDRLMEVLAAIEETGAVDVVITPEGFLDGYVSTEAAVGRDNMADYAIHPETSDYVGAVRQWARRNRAWLIYGCTRKAPDGLFNTALILDRRGGLVGTYDKLHLQRHDLKYDPGRHLRAYDSDFGTFGVMICADRRWPETVRTLALQGAGVIFNPTYGMHGDLNLCMMRTRAYENGIYIAFTHPGQSLITGPGGNIVCNNERDEETFTVTQVDLSDALADRDGHLRDRRADLYKL